MTIVPKGGGITGGGVLVGGGGTAIGAVVVTGAAVVVGVSRFGDTRLGFVVVVVVRGGLVVVVVVAASCTASAISRAHALRRSFVAPSAGTRTVYRTVAVPPAGTVTKNCTIGSARRTTGCGSKPSVRARGCRDR